MNPEQRAVFQRVLIVLEASRGDGHALERAAALAMRRQAQLLGLLVEDSELLRIAELPFTREIGALSARTRPLEPTGLRHRMDGHLRAVRRQLRQLAHRQALSWSLEVVRSRLRTAMPETILPSDLLILQRPGARAGSAAHEVAEVAELAPCPVLVLDPETVQRDGSIAVLATPGPAGQRAAAMAAALGTDLGVEPLTVLVPPGDTGSDRDSILATIEGLEVSARAHPLPALETEALTGALDHRSGSILVVARDALPGHYRRALALRPGPGLLLVP
jgi:hypothetical protein